MNAEVTKIVVIDKDVRGTPAWHATFNIIKGNEDGSFKIETNRDSNTGTLCIKKVIRKRIMQNVTGYISTFI